MKPAALLVLIPLGFVGVSACGGSHDLTALTAPPPIVVPPPGSAVTGTITIASVSHAPGSTLQLQPCPTVQGHSTGPLLCNDQLRLTVDVTVNSDIPNAELQATFSDQGQRCAFASSSRAALAAGTRTSFITSRITFVQKDADPGQPADLGCDLPPLAAAIDITDIEVTLVNRDNQHDGQLRGSFPSRYAFVLPEMLTASGR